MTEPPDWSLNPPEHADWSRYEHAWLLRAEGLPLKEIATRLGVSSRERARQMILTFARRVNRAIKNTRWELHDVPARPIRTYQVWYMKSAWHDKLYNDEHFPYSKVDEDYPIPDPTNVAASHVHLLDLELEDSIHGEKRNLDRVYERMQGKNWKKAENWLFGEKAFDLIKQYHLNHTHMTIGDIVIVDDTIFVRIWGWWQLKENCYLEEQGK